MDVDMLASLIWVSINILSKSSIFLSFMNHCKASIPLCQKAPIASRGVPLGSLLAYWCWRLSGAATAASLPGVGKIRLHPNKPSSSRGMSLSLPAS